MTADTLKAEAHRLVDALPEEATWEDLAEQIFVRQAIEKGLADAAAGRMRPTEDVRARLGLAP